MVAGVVKIRQKQHAKLTILEISFLNKYVKMYNFSTLSLSFSPYLLCMYIDIFLFLFTFKSVHNNTHTAYLQSTKIRAIHTKPNFTNCVPSWSTSNLLCFTLLYIMNWPWYAYVSWRIRHLINYQYSRWTLTFVLWLQFCWLGYIPETSMLSSLSHSFCVEQKAAAAIWLATLGQSNWLRFSHMPSVCMLGCYGPWCDAVGRPESAAWERHMIITFIQISKSWMQFH